MDGKMAKADRFADGLTPEERELIHCFQAHFKVDCNRGRVFSRESQQQDRGERQQLLGLCEGSACRRGSCVAVRVVFSGRWMSTPPQPGQRNFTNSRHNSCRVVYRIDVC